MFISTFFPSKDLVKFSILFSCLLFFGFFLSCPLLLPFFAFFLWSSFFLGFLIFSFSLRFCQASQHHGRVFLSPLVLWEKLSMLVKFDFRLHPSPGEWGYYGRCSIVYMLEVPEHGCDYQCCSNHSIFFWVFSLSLRVAFLLFHVCYLIAVMFSYLKISLNIIWAISSILFRSG